MASPETWTRALSRSSGMDAFTLDFTRLGVHAQCRSLTAAEISDAMALSDEASARQLLYLACPSLQQAGDELVYQGILASAQDITLKLPYSDVLQAASLILQYSGAGPGMVRIISGVDAALQPYAEATSEAVELDGYALLQQWAAQDRNANAFGHMSDSIHNPDAFFSTQSLRHNWTSDAGLMASDAEATNSATDGYRGRTLFDAVTPERVAEIICQRLCDAAGNM